MTAMTAATIDTLLRRPVPARAWACPGRRSPRAGTGCGSTSRSRAPGSTSRSSGRRWPGRPCRYDGEFYTLPLPDGPGKALKLGFHPLRADDPDLPRRGRAEEPGARRRDRRRLAGRLLLARVTRPSCSPRSRPAGPGPARPWPASTWCPRVPVVVGDDVAACAELVRGYAALYLGGMGSREQNFYNQLAIRMGFGDAAREVQDLYLAKRQRDAAAAVPLEFIDRDRRCSARSERIADRLQRLRRGRRHDAVGEPLRGRPRVGRGDPAPRSPRRATQAGVGR